MGNVGVLIIIENDKLNKNYVQLKIARFTLVPIIFKFSKKYS